MKVLLILLVFSLYQVKEYSGKIIYIKDGDSFVLQTEEGNITVRMDGIDAPEKRQSFGMKSKQFMYGYLHKQGKIVYSGIDKYGRTLGVLWVDGININLLSVQEGFAWHYKKYSSDMALANAEIKAREERKGLWADSAVVEPWEWRKLKK